MSPFVGPLIECWNKKILLIVTGSIVAVFAVVLVLAGTISAMAGLTRAIM